MHYVELVDGIRLRYGCISSVVSMQGDANNAHASATKPRMAEC